MGRAARRVSAGLAKASAIWLIEGREKFTKGHAEPTRDPVQHVQRRCLPTPLQITQVGPVHARAARQFLLGDAEAFP